MAALGWNANLIEPATRRGPDSMHSELPAHGAPVADLQILTVLRPYLLLASVAFTLGFIGYWSLGQTTAVSTSLPPAEAWQEPASAPAPDTPLKSIRHI